MFNNINNMLMAVDGASVLKTLMFLVLGMVLMFIVMTVLYAIIRLLNYTDKHNDKIKAFWKRTFAQIKAIFGGKKDEETGNQNDEKK